MTTTTVPNEHAPPPVLTNLPANMLLIGDVARILTTASGREIKPTTVVSYVKESKPTVGSKPGRYADNPMPMPYRLPNGTLWWPSTAEPDLIAWVRARPGRSHGKGRQARVPYGPYKKKSQS